MTQRRPRHNPTLVRVTPTATPVPRAGATAPTPPKSSANGWLTLAGIVALLFAIGKCSSSGTGGDTAAEIATGNAQEAIVSAVQAQSPPAVEPLSRTAVDLGLRHAKLAAREGLAGDMIYSQNCYDALGRKFSWAKLDACGALDAEAALTVEEDDSTTPGAEAAWFQSEAAAGRYLKAAIAAGEPAEKADTRWSDLQARAAGRHRSRPAPTPSPTATPGQIPDGDAPTDEADNVAV